MTDLASAGEAAEAPDDEVEAPRDYEADARKQGWKPKDEFKGPEGRWKDAETFVLDSEENLHVVKSVLASERKENADRLNRIEKATSLALERLNKEHDTKVQEMEGQLRYYASKGDLAGYDQVNAKLTEVKADAPRVEGNIETPDDVFARDNPWYGEDGDLAMTGFAEKFSQRLNKSNPTLALDENLKRTKDAVMKEFPHKFAKGEVRRTFAAVDPGSSFPSAGRRQGGGKSASDLPSDIKTIGERFVRQGLFKSLDEYAKDYFSPENAQ